MRPSAVIVVLILWSLAATGCATSPVEDIRPGDTPAMETDEAGLWMAMDRAETRLKTSGRIITDQKLNAYTRNMICRLAPQQCDRIRFYLVETPHFNAAMAPNGFMQIWSGLLLRAQNEDQLAYVLGHEIGHFNRRHSLQQWRTVRNTASGLVVFQLLTAGAGIGWAGDIAQLAALAGIFAYSRDQEREADDIGLVLMAEAGYDPREAPVIWRNLIEEQEASGDKEPVFFFASHPSSAERLETLEARAAEMAGRMGQRASRREEYADLIGPFCGRWIHDELQKRDFAATQVVLEHLFAQDRNPGEL